MGFQLDGFRARQREPSHLSFVWMVLGGLAKIPEFGSFHRSESSYWSGSYLSPSNDGKRARQREGGQVGGSNMDGFYENIECHSWRRFSTLSRSN